MPAGKAFIVEGEKISALAIKHAGIVHAWYSKRDVTAQLLDGRGVATERVRFADAVSFIILKALAFTQRAENKDAGDLIHVLRYYGPGLEALAADFREAGRRRAQRCNQRGGGRLGAALQRQRPCRGLQTRRPGRRRHVPARARRRRGGTDVRTTERKRTGDGVPATCSRPVAPSRSDAAGVCWRTLTPVFTLVPHECFRTGIWRGVP